MVNADLPVNLLTVSECIENSCSAGFKHKPPKECRRHFESKLKFLGEFTV